jgi:hypothetical protein
MTKRSSGLRRSLSLVAAAGLVAGLAGPAIAQAPAPAPAPAPAKAVKVKKIVIDDGETVEGDVPTGAILPVDARTFSKHPSLIRLRVSFVDKIMASAQGL